MAIDSVGLGDRSSVAAAGTAGFRDCKLLQLPVPYL
jgi:hypothetical protein